jgi:glycosyltransferase involved in cell wall biosynthesis
MTRKKILLFIDWYLPGYKAGGPIRSASNLVERLNDEFEFKVVTCNTDLEEDTPYPNVQTDKWVNSKEGTAVYYFSTKKPEAKAVKSIIHKEQPDIVYLNSMYSIPFTLNPLRVVKKLYPDTKIVIAPRGMLSPGALLIKPFKKRLFLIFARSIGWFDSISWHASSNTEKNEIQNVFGTKANVTVARNLTKLKTITKYRRVKTKGKLRLLYIARVSPVKNLLQCLEVLSQLNTSQQIDFDIYGTVDDQEYFKQCRKVISELPENIRVEFKGTIENEHLGEVIREYHFLFHLTLNENFGHSIFESLSEGCPVIISDQTPWKKLESKSAGWDLQLDSNDNIIDKIKVAAEMDQETFDDWSDGAYSLANEIIEDKETESSNRELFRNA